MKKKFYFSVMVLFVLIIGMNATAQGQQVYEEVFVTVKGRVLDNDDRFGIPGAKIFIYQALPGNSPRLIGGTETKGDGSYSISEYTLGDRVLTRLTPGLYYIGFYMAGYTSQIIYEEFYVYDYPMNQTIWKDKYLTWDASRFLSFLRGKCNAGLNKDMILPERQRTYFLIS